MYWLIGFTTALAISSHAAAAGCFFPDGGEASLDTACNPNALVSACCFDNQACLSNGLCVSDPHNETLARFHRGTCTDAGWKSGNCPRHCLPVKNNGAPVYSCNATGTDSYCCGDNCECNNNQFETFSFPDDNVYTLTIIGESFTQTHTSSASSTRSLAPTTTTTSGTSTAYTAPVLTTPKGATSTPTEEAKSSSKTAIGVGIGVGVGVGASVLIGAAFFLWRRKRNNAASLPYSSNASGKPAEMDSTENYGTNDKYAQNAASVPTAQSSRSQRPVELASETAPIELPATSIPRPMSFKTRL